MAWRRLWWFVSHSTESVDSRLDLENAHVPKTVKVELWDR